MIKQSRNSKKEPIDNFKDGLVSLGRTSKVELRHPNDSEVAAFDSNIAARKKQNGEGAGKRSEASAHLVKQYTLAYERFEDSLRKSVALHLPLDENRIVSYNLLATGRRGHYHKFRYREMDAVSEKIGDLRVVVEFKLRLNEKNNSHLHLFKASQQIYKSGGLLLKLPDTKVSGCMIVIGDQEYDPPLTPFAEADWEAIKSTPDTITTLQISLKDAFETARSMGTIITPFQQALITTSPSSKPGKELDAPGALEALILPAFQQVFNDIN